MPASGTQSRQLLRAIATFERHTLRPSRHAGEAHLPALRLLMPIRATSLKSGWLAGSKALCARNAFHQRVSRTGKASLAFSLRTPLAAHWCRRLIHQTDGDFGGLLPPARPFCADFVGTLWNRRPGAGQTLGLQRIALAISSDLLLMVGVRSCALRRFGGIHGLNHNKGTVLGYTSDRQDLAHWHSLDRRRLRYTASHHAGH